MLTLLLIILMCVIVVPSGCQGPGAGQQYNKQHGNVRANLAASAGNGQWDWDWDWDWEREWSGVAGVESSRVESSGTAQLK
jgi:hypothetical protein